MATAGCIDCRSYYIDRNVTTAKSGREICRGSDAVDGVFSVAKYVIDRSGTGVDQNSSDSVNVRQDRADSVVDNLADGALGGATNAVWTGSDVSTSGHGRRRSVRGRLRRMVRRLESFLQEMKVVYSLISLFN